MFVTALYTAKTKTQKKAALAPSLKIHIPTTLVYVEIGNHRERTNTVSNFKKKNQGARTELTSRLHALH